MEELIDLFQDIEQKNFSLFNSINALNSDIEASETAIAETKMDIEKFKGPRPASRRARPRAEPRLCRPGRVDGHAAEEGHPRPGGEAQQDGEGRGHVEGGA